MLPADPQPPVHIPWCFLQANWPPGCGPLKLALGSKRVRASAMPDWLFQLTCEKFDLEDLPGWFCTLDLQVIEEHGGY